MAAKKQTDLVASIPQHILESPHLSGVQRKAFGQAKRATAKAAPAKKSTAKKAAKKSATSASTGSGYLSGAGKDETP
jgi:hypothetical protein